MNSTKEKEKYKMKEELTELDAQRNNNVPRKFRQNQ